MTRLLRSYKSCNFFVKHHIWRSPGGHSKLCALDKSKDTQHRGLCVLLLFFLLKVMLLRLLVLVPIVCCIFQRMFGSNTAERIQISQAQQGCVDTATLLGLHSKDSMSQTDNSSYTRAKPDPMPGLWCQYSQPLNQPSWHQETATHCQQRNCKCF